MAPPEHAIRPAAAEDVPAIERLVGRAYERYVPRLGRRPSPMDEDHRAQVAAGEVWVAEADGALVGALVLQQGPGHLFVDNVAVDPDRQGEGLGRALLEHAEAEARRRGLAELRLYTNQAMTENQTLYEHLGWQETARGVEKGYNRVWFRKRLMNG